MADVSRIYGAKKDVRKPDELVRFYVPKAVERPKIIDWAAYAPEIFHQDGIGMCVACGHLELMCYDAARLGIIKPGMPIAYSQWYLYNRARKMRGWLGSDTGCYPEDASDALCDFGVLDYALWPVVHDNIGNIVFDRTDPSTKEDKAIRFPDMIKSRVNNGIEGLWGALSDGPVTIAVPFFEEWEDYSGGVLPKITKNSKVRGRHEMLYDGLRYDDGLLYGPNSWGTRWGVDTTATGKFKTKGRFVMDMEAIETIKQYFDGYDSWDIDFNPIPPPPPAKLSLTIHSAGKGAYGSGQYDLGAEADIYAGTVNGFDFSSWSPRDNVGNPFAPKTTIRMLESVDLTATFYQRKKKRCPLFNLAEIKNKIEGI